MHVSVKKMKNIFMAISWTGLVRLDLGILFTCFLKQVSNSFPGFAQRNKPFCDVQDFSL